MRLFLSSPNSFSTQQASQTLGLVTTKSISLSDRQFHLITRAMADPHRYLILEKLGQSETSRCACGDIRDCIPVSPATLSHHMKELENAGLVESKREGKFVSYTLCREVLAAYIQRISGI
ncbi:winged helix-turn-helix transcriptional regulator [Edaphobacter sp. HDX4]